MDSRPRRESLALGVLHIAEIPSVIDKEGNAPLTFSAVAPENGFDFFYDANGNPKARWDDFTAEDWDAYGENKNHYHQSETIAA